MSADNPNIHPEFDRMLGRAEKERLLHQKGRVVWLFGLSGSGKSTLATGLERRLHEEGYFTQILDGDNIRAGLNSNLGFSDEDRAENIRRIAEVAAILLHAGIITICSFITPKEAYRRKAREIVGEEDILEVYLQCSYGKCSDRDPKGLYAMARSGKIKDFTGRDSDFEAPQNPDFLIDTEHQSEEKCLELLHEYLLPYLRLDR